MQVLAAFTGAFLHLAQQHLALWLGVDQGRLIDEERIPTEETALVGHFHDAVFDRILLLTTPIFVVLDIQG